MRSSKAVSLVAGIAGVAVAVILAVSNITDGSVDCGSLFDPETYSASTLDSAFSQVVCEDARSGRIGMLVVVGVAGIALTIYGLVGSGQPRSAGPSPIVPTGKSQDNVAAQLAQLSDLRASGALSEEEFSAAKERLLADEDT